MQNFIAIGVVTATWATVGYSLAFAPDVGGGILGGLGLAGLGEAVPGLGTLTVWGAGLLWFGWLGFTAGSALAANDLAARAMVNTHLAGVGGMRGWVLLEHRLAGHTTTLGAVSGAVAGLVAITPAAGYVPALPSMAIGRPLGRYVCSRCD